MQSVKGLGVFLMASGAVWLMSLVLLAALNWIEWRGELNWQFGFGAVPAIVGGCIVQLHHVLNGGGSNRWRGM